MTALTDQLRFSHECMINSHLNVRISHLPICTSLYYVQLLLYLQDWPDNFHMSDEAFVKHAEKLETQDFEDDIRSLSASLYQLTAAREDTIRKLRISADYLDSIWFR